MGSVRGFKSFHCGRPQLASLFAAANSAARSSAKLSGDSDMGAQRQDACVYQKRGLSNQRANCGGGGRAGVCGIALH